MKKHLTQGANTMENKKKAVVLFSGGLDSSTCIYFAKKENYDITAISFLYGQKHQHELEFGKRLLHQAGIENHFIANLGFHDILKSALTDSNIDIPKGGADLDKENFIPSTYVPARNLLFLSYASAAAENIGAHAIFLGVNALDYSGYPDCRPDFIDSFQKTVNLATRAGRTGENITIQTPLINKTKKEIIELGNSLGVPYHLTWSCYDPQNSSDPEKVKPCGECDSCLLRKQGFEAAGLKDPLLS